MMKRVEHGYDSYHGYHGDIRIELYHKPNKMMKREKWGSNGGCCATNFMTDRLAPGCRTVVLRLRKDQIDKDKSNKLFLPSIKAWHIPQRTEGLNAKPVDSLHINKVKPVQKATKRIRVAQAGVVPNLYCPVPQPIASAEFTTSLMEQLGAANSDVQILKVLPKSPNPPSVPSKFGAVPHGSVLSYQQKPQQKNGDIINHPCKPTYPAFPVPPLPSTYHHVPSQTEQEVYLGLHLTLSQAHEVEENTRDQSHNKIWHDVRKHRLTSSIFKQVCSRKKDHSSLAQRFLSAKNIQTAAMKFGIEHEPEAAKLYAEVTGNNVYLSGFAINPSAPHLGASPDRRCTSIMLQIHMVC
ncbi:PREDICTED: uncharacterized protein LOC109474389 [Branchiostoma belcheri]|uniref:Uncharacterized protein LOC109474389 n=1 Tax=Branchiostoma belcheri TaxID=7741 RepID=A0A6P4YLA2_BRABE|nr:PREDICTED: uncharacterized protein LOC109474389 [Branchiostoma belcheri]